MWLTYPFLFIFPQKLVYRGEAEKPALSICLDLLVAAGTTDVASSRVLY